VTKKQYFYWLWALTSIAAIISVVVISVFALEIAISKSEPAPIQTSAGIMLLVIIGIVRILFNGFVIAAGLDFSQKIGARLLFLTEQFDFKKDIFKPAVLAAIAYSGACLLAHGLSIKYMGIDYPWLYLFSNLEINWFTSMLMVISFRLFEVINEDIWLLLLGVSGVALLVKKIISHISASRAMLVSIFLCSFLSVIFHVIWKHGFSMQAIVPSVEMIGQTMLLGLLFWKKGFETAVLCHLIIVFILYLVAPAVVFALGF